MASQLYYFVKGEPKASNLLIEVMWSINAVEELSLAEQGTKWPSAKILF